MLRQASRRVNLLNSLAVRSFGGAPHDPLHKYTYAEAPSQDTRFKHPSQVDMDY